MEIKRIIDVHVPIYDCNLKCDYCYVSQLPNRHVSPDFKYSPETVKKALSIKRLNGICHFNICGMGETLIPEGLIDYIRVLLENGHTVMIVTNGTLTKRIARYMELPKELKSHLGFKFSFHYLELKRLDLIDVFWDNVKLVKNNGCSFSVELTANDSYEPFIKEIQKCCMTHVGALCHVTVPRDEATRGINLLSKHKVSEFYDIWKVFDSKLFEQKMRHWGERRKEFCYAGLWSGLLNMDTGEFNACYNQPKMMKNIFEYPERQYEFCPTGRCEIAHCFNGHSFLAWGVIPEINEESYLDVRDRVDENGDHWINETMRSQFKEKLFDHNEIFSIDEKRIIAKKHVYSKGQYKITKLCHKLKQGVVKIAKG